MNGKLTILLVALIVVPAAAASQGLFSKPVARVLKVKGTVTIEDKEGKTRAAVFYGSVRENEKLLVKADADITLGFRSDGHMERLALACRATVTGRGIAAPVKVEKMEPPKKHRKFVGQAVKDLSPFTREGVRFIKGFDDETSPDKDKLTSDGLQPIATSTVLNPQPTLSWPPVARAARYDVALAHLNGPRVWKATTTETTLECTGFRQLRSGDNYQWEVTATLQDQSVYRACRGEFAVATDEQRAEAAQIKELIDGSEVEYLALAAEWYATNGLLAEAIAVSRRLVEIEPQSASLHLALAKLYDLAGRKGDAQKTRDRAKKLEPSTPPKSTRSARVKGIFRD